MGSTIAESLKTLSQKLDETIKSFDAFSLELESAPVDELLDDIKETFEEKLREPIERLVNKLKKDEPLSSKEIQLIEKWVIGDAEFYTKMENNLIDWVAECKRLFEVLKHYSFEGVEDDENKLLAIGALLTDLKFTLMDVIRYSEAMNRVDQFKTMTQGGMPNAETKKFLAEMIERRLESAKFEKEVS